MRNRVLKRTVSALAAGFVALLMASSAFAGDILNFRVLKDGEPIGYEKVDITQTANGVINAEPYAVQTNKVGDEKLRIENRETPATHYEMSGDVERDLWYGTDGYLLKTSFKRKGYDIDFVRVDAIALQE